MKNSSNSNNAIAGENVSGNFTATEDKNVQHRIGGGTEMENLSKTKIAIVCEKIFANPKVTEGANISDRTGGGTVVFIRSTDDREMETVVCDIPANCYADDMEAIDEITAARNIPMSETPYIAHFLKENAVSGLTEANAEDPEIFIHIAATILYFTGGGNYLYDLESPVCFPHAISQRYLDYVIELAKGNETPFYRYSIK